MAKSKETIGTMERRFIARSGSAFAAASKRSYACGLHNVISDQGTLYEVAPDGSRKFLKHVEPPTPVKRGEKVHIR